MATFTPNPDSLGFKLGRALGWTAAQATQRSSQAVEATGEFGRNVVAGTRTGYRVTTADLKRARAQALLAEALAIEAKEQPAPAAAPAPTVIVSA